MKYAAAIFDMDGLLLDTERVCMRIFQDACTALDLPFIEPVYLSVIGRSAEGIAPIFESAYGANYPALHDEWRRRYHGMVMQQAIPVKAGVVELLIWLRQQGVPTAVATSTQMEIARAKLHLAKLAGYFDVVTTGCEVEKGKPAPDIYLLAARRLAAEPTHCLAFEDSTNGVRSAVSAGLITYQIPDLVAPCDEVRALGHHIMPSLSAVLTHLRG